MKKIISLLVAIIIVCVATCAVLALPDSGSLSVAPSNTEIALEDEVALTVSLSDVSVAKSCALLFSYDSNVFELVSGDWSLTGAALSNFDTSKNAATIAYTSEKNLNGDVFTLKLKVKADASTGNTTINVTPTIKNGKTTVDCAAGSATIKIVCKVHSFTNYVSNNDATCTADGTKTAKCDNCDATDTKADVGSKLPHSFTNYVRDNNATCTADGTKTAKCDNCDATDTITDTGSKLPHSFTNYVSNNNATCEDNCTETAK